MNMQKSATIVCRVLGSSNTMKTMTPSRYSPAVMTLPFAVEVERRMWSRIAFMAFSRGFDENTERNRPKSHFTMPVWAGGAAKRTSRYVFVIPGAYRWQSPPSVPTGLSSRKETLQRGFAGSAPPQNTPLAGGARSQVRLELATSGLRRSDFRVSTPDIGVPGSLHCLGCRNNVPFQSVNEFWSFGRVRQRSRGPTSRRRGWCAGRRRQARERTRRGLVALSRHQGDWFFSGLAPARPASMALITLFGFGSRARRRA